MGDQKEIFEGIKYMPISSRPLAKKAYHVVDMITRGDPIATSPDRSITVPRKSTARSAGDPAETLGVPANLIGHDDGSLPEIPEAEVVGEMDEGDDEDEMVSKMMEEIVDDVNKQRSKLCVQYFCFI